MTISPPAKLIPGKDDLPQVLCHGIDTLYLNIDVKWKNSEFFSKLAQLKGYAQNSHTDCPATFYPHPNGQPWKCVVKQHGARGHEWILESAEFTLRIGRWLEPIQKPSIVAEIRSEALWHLGPANALKRLLQIVRGQHGVVVSVKPGRVDLCVDILIDENLWQMDLILYRVTRASYAAPHFARDVLTGISIGRGTISARIYDKPLEIKKQSGKTWMYDIWGVDEVPDGRRVLRIEFQLRREVITQLGIDKVGHLFRSLDSIWAYCTKKWLKFRSNPGKQTNLRKTFPWWEVVQAGFGGAQHASPSIRFKAFLIKEDQAFGQIYGNLTSLEASRIETFTSIQKLDTNLEISLSMINREALARNKGGFAFADEVEAKLSKFQRTELKLLEVHGKRKKLGQPSNFSPEQLKRAMATQQRLNFDPKQEG